MSTILRVWTPPGPVALAAYRSTSEIVITWGPQGSGKTGTYIAKTLAFSRMQVPQPCPVGSVPGAPQARAVRRSRLTCLKTSYRRLWENFIPSWFEWLPQHDPENGVEWIGADGGPATQTITMPLRDGSAAVLEAVFMAIGEISTEEALEDFFAGLQTTWVWMNELHTFPRAVYDKALGRVGRYPRQADGGPVSPGLWGDMNSPIIGTWQHEAIMQGEWRMHRDLFRQPSGESPDAENVKNLDPEYYARAKRRMPAHEYDRKVRNNFGRRLDGKPVHDYDDNLYTADGPLEPIIGLPLIVAMDAGGSPSAVVMQRRRDGQLRVYAEHPTAPGTGPERFARGLRALLDTQRFAAWRGQGEIIAVADPSSEYGADKVEQEKNWMQRVSAELGVRVRPAASQDPRLRRQALDDCLVMDGTVPLFQLDPCCKVLRKALMGEYKFRKMQIVGEDVYDPKPMKNDASHTAEACQYGCLEEGGLDRAKGRMPREDRPNGIRDALVDAGYRAPATGAPRRGLPGRGYAAELARGSAATRVISSR